MDTSAAKYFERMTEILIKKRALMNELLELTRDQSGLIQSDTLDALRRLIEEKQSRIDNIDRLDEEFGVYMERLKMTAGVKSLDELDVKAFPAAAALKIVTGEILGLIKEISGLEKQNSEKSKELLSNIGAEIQKLNRGKIINKAYAPGPINAPSYFLDKKK